jgi:NADH:ubiquinone oxidoreductase subunit F (NADH-binding)
MTLVHRVLSPEPMTSLDLYLARAGGAGLDAALSKEPAEIIEIVLESGLRGRGGAGFPTGIKWQTVAGAATDAPTTVVINGAEGEPGTFKDRTILRNNPYIVLEGALIAARAVDAPRVVIALKKSFTTELTLMRRAIEEVRAAGWLQHADVSVYEGPHEYLYGEETALLEVLDGRYPFPRIDAPYRRGIIEMVETTGDVDSESALSSHVEMAVQGGETGAPPTLVDNVETIANVARIIARGAKWFRTEGTDKSPGTIVCTISGDTVREGVGEIIMGTTLREAIEEIGGGVRPGRIVKAVLPGVSNALITGDDLDTPLTYEDMAGIGSGLGSAGYIVYDDTADMAAVAAGVSRFLAVESCGQCTPCKRDGLMLSGLLDKLCEAEASPRDLDTIRSLVDSVADRARCNLATQQQVVIGSALAKFESDLTGHIGRGARAVERRLVAEFLDIEGDVAAVDERFRQKQPDWTYGTHSSGQWPAEKLDDHRAHENLE